MRGGGVCSQGQLLPSSVAASEEEEALAKRLRQQLREGGPEVRAKAVAALQEEDVLPRLCLQSQVGSRAVQAALEEAHRSTAASLAAKLQGRVLQAVTSPHGNHVVQKILLMLTPGEVPFLLDEMGQHGRALELACHEYGCRVFCKLLEHSSQHDGTARLVDEVLLHAEQLICDEYGHHVAEKCLEYGQPQQAQRVVQALRWSLLYHTQHRNAAFLIVRALAVVETVQREEMTRQLAWELRSPQDLVWMVATDHGRMVGRNLLKYAGPEAKNWIAWLCAAAIHMNLGASSPVERFLRQNSRDAVVVFGVPVAAVVVVAAAGGG